jgi:hypothetical protein
MTYTAQELRLADAFALLLAGLGIVFLLAGAAGFAVASPARHVSSGYSPKSGKRSAKAVKVSPGALRAWAPFLMGTTFLALGVALGAGVRRVARNGGEDVEELLSLAKGACPRKDG